MIPWGLWDTSQAFANLKEALLWSRTLPDSLSISLHSFHSNAEFSCFPTPVHFGADTLLFKLPEVITIPNLIQFQISCWWSPGSAAFMMRKSIPQLSVKASFTIPNSSQKCLPPYEMTYHSGLQETGRLPWAQNFSAKTQRIPSKPGQQGHIPCLFKSPMLFIFVIMNSILHCAYS